MDSERRRELLRALGAAGAATLAGCQDAGRTARTSDGEETTTPETTATTDAGSTVTVELSADGATGAESSRLRVTGTVAADRALDRVSVEAGGQSATVDAAGQREVDVDLRLDVPGGRRYEVEVTVVDAEGESVESTLSSGYVPLHVEPVETDRTVGAHYYPWYEMHAGHRNWTDRTVSTPVLGEYSASNRAVVDQHLKWCLEHGITWLSMSWWGPNSGSDTALTDTILEMERFSDVSFSILYETLGRLERYGLDFDEPGAKSRLRSDFEYLDQRFFGRENYHRIDGRPVVFFYVANQLTGDVAGAFADATAAIDADPYVLASVPFGRAPDAYPISAVADGVTSYNPYQARPDIEEVFHGLYDRGNELLELGAEAADLDYTPVVIPGFNDTGLPARIREDNPVLEASPERFARVLDQVNPHLADAEGVLVTSFNEWYENTQVEPSEAYGTRYLELVRDELATGESAGFDPDGITFTLQFNRTVTPGGADDRQLAFMLHRLAFSDGDEELAAYDVGTGTDLTFLRGAFGTESNDGDTWRWLGGPDARTVVFVRADVAAADTATLTGMPMPDVDVEADVFFDGERTDHVVFDDGSADYTVSLT